MDSPRSSPKRSKKACTECRQQKAKCDAYLNPDRPCSRCVRMRAHCVISDPFKREHKRQRLSRLEQEANELRRKLKSSQTAIPRSSPLDILAASAQTRVDTGSHTGNLSVSGPPPPPSIPLYSQQPLSSRGCIDSSMSQLEEPVSVGRVSDPTVSRSLHGVEVTGNEIDEIFELFFHRYAQFLPIFDPQTRPNSYYSQSPFLFWAIIGVACRTYPSNPTLMTALSRSINEMALLSIASTSAPWHTIQGLLLILTWPFPKDNTKPDITFPLSGLLLHIAMQNGLHIPMSSHEFSRVKIPAPSEADMVRRSELWAYCILVYQRVCVSKGQSARALVNLEQDPNQSQVLFQKLAPSLILKVKCLELAVRCSAAVLEIGVRTVSFNQERALDILLRNFEAQVNDLEGHAVSEDDKFHTTMCRLHIYAFHFYKNQKISSTDCLMRLVNTSCTVIESIEKLGKQLDSLATVPFYIFFGLLVASVGLLRILKSSASHEVDTERARASLFTAINLAKQMSIAHNDTAAKTVIILDQLWNSSKAFRRSDGSEYTALRIRSRLILSPALDAMWWWRDEFEAQYRSLVGDTSEGLESGRISGVTGNSSTIVTDRQDPLLFDDQFLEDFEWALGDEAIYTTAEAYSANWAAVGNSQ